MASMTAGLSATTADSASTTAGEFLSGSSAWLQAVAPSSSADDSIRSVELARNISSPLGWNRVRIQRRCGAEPLQFLGQGGLRQFTHMGVDPATIGIEEQGRRQAARAGFLRYRRERVEQARKSTRLNSSQ